MSLYPIADCLVIEQRQCQCGQLYCCPADVIHRLLASCAGEPRKLVLRPRKHDEFPMALATTHMVRVSMDHCPLCWSELQHNTSWLDASAIVPKRPLVEEIGLILSDKAINEEIRFALEKAGWGPKGKRVQSHADQAMDL